MEAERLQLEASLHNAHEAAANLRTDADTYRRENRELLANYDGWLKTLVECESVGTPLADQGHK